jgi:hypothetical protein
LALRRHAGPVYVIPAFAGIHGPGPGLLTKQYTETPVVIDAARCRLIGE